MKIEVAPYDDKYSILQFKMEFGPDLGVSYPLKPCLSRKEEVERVRSICLAMINHIDFGEKI